MKQLSVACGVALTMATASPALALNARTWISGHGADQAGCGPVASPCRTLQYAHDQTSPGGEIDVLDPAGYGSLIIESAADQPLEFQNVASLGTVQPDGSVKPAGASGASRGRGLRRQSRRSGTFMERLEERWEKRRRDGAW